MERVEDRRGVLKLVVDRVLVAMERVQRRHLDATPEGVATFVQPVGVGLPGPARNEVEQPGSSASGLVTREIDHSGQRLPRGTEAWWPLILRTPTPISAHPPSPACHARPTAGKKSHYSIQLSLPDRRRRQHC